MSTSPVSIDCIVLRCSRQAEMYVYLRADLSVDDIPEALRKRTGTLTQVMCLTLSAQRPLARVPVLAVMQRLLEDGVYLQMPPSEQIHAKLHFGD